MTANVIAGAITREGDVLAVLLRNDAAFAGVVFACRIGGTCSCPLNRHVTVQAARFTLADSGARDPRRSRIAGADPRRAGRRGPRA